MTIVILSSVNGKDLPSPDTPHAILVVLIVVVLIPVREILVPTVVGTVLRSGPVVRGNKMEDY